MLKLKANQTLVAFNPKSPHMLKMGVRIKSNAVKIIQAYKPIFAEPKEEIDEFYNNLQKITQEV